MKILKQNIKLIIDENDENNLDDSFDFSFDKEKDINDTYKDIKNIKNILIIQLGQ